MSDLLTQYERELVAEVERLRERVAGLEAEVEEEAQIRARLTELLRGTAIALKGPEPEGTLWSWHDLPELAAQAAARTVHLETQRDQLQATNTEEVGRRREAEDKATRWKAAYDAVVMDRETGGSRASGGDPQ